MLQYPNHKPLKTLALDARMKYIPLPTLEFDKINFVRP